MIRVDRNISIDENHIHLSFVRSSGPGGQNVNKVATACQLRFDVNKCDLPRRIKKRLITIAGKKMTDDGTLVIDARRYRSQNRNRQDAIERLVELLQQAATRRKPRIPTRPTAASRQRRLESKRRTSRRKQLRQRVVD